MTAAKDRSASHPLPSRTKRLLGTILATVLGLLYLVHALLLFCFGFANVLTSLLFFSTIAFFSLRGLNFGGRRLGIARQTRLNLGLLLGSFFTSLAMADLYLRYGVARYPSYEERNGGFFYIPMYRTASLLRLRQQWVGSARLHINPRLAVRMRRKTEFSVDLSTNSEGLRDGEHATVKPPGQFRIVGVGDSFTEGIGATFDSTWLQQLRQMLAQEGCTGVGVISGGVAGSDPFFEYALLKDRLLEYAPDVVIVTLNSSDLDDTVVRGGMERFREDGTIAFRRGPAWEWLYGSSYVIRHVVHDVLGYDRLLLPEGAQALRTAQALDELYDVCQACADLSRERAFRLLLVFHPLRHETLLRKLDLADLVRRLERQQRIATLDLLEYYARVEGISAMNIDDYYWRLDTHHTARGYRAFAEGVASRLGQLGWLPGSCRGPEAAAGSVP